MYTKSECEFEINHFSITMLASSIAVLQLRLMKSRNILKNTVSEIDFQEVYKISQNSESQY